MARRVVPLLALLALAAVACGDGGGSIFEDTLGTVPESVGTIVVEAAGEAWTLPAAVCLRDDGDHDIVLVFAQREAAAVRSLVGSLISGWPTTTYALSFDHDTYERDLQTAGVTALALAAVIGEQPALEKSWADWEQGFADPEQGWGPPNEISRRITQWRAGAESVTHAIGTHCAAG